MLERVDRVQLVVKDTARFALCNLLCVNSCATLTPTLLIEEGEGAVSILSPPEGERDRVRGRLDAG